MGLGGGGTRTSFRLFPHLPHDFESFGERAPHSGHSVMDSSVESGIPHLGHLLSPPARSRPHCGHSDFGLGRPTFGKSLDMNSGELLVSTFSLATTLWRSVAQTGHLVSPGGTLLPHSGHSIECSLAKLCTSGETMLAVRVSSGGLTRLGRY
jgi:hypothetical protein